MNAGRRSFLILGTFGTLGGYLSGVSKSVLGDIGASWIENAASFLWSDLTEDTYDRVPMDRDKSDLIDHLFLRSPVDSIKFHPADNWEQNIPDTPFKDGTLTYGHEASVCNTIASFLHADMKIPYKAMKIPPPQELNVSKVIIGSGASNSFAEIYTGKPGNPLFETSTCRLVYGVGMGRGSFFRKQYGFDIERNAHAICGRDKRPLLHPESQNKTQTDDYLLVTRIPGEKEGTVITLFTGLHGPGTRAAEILFSEHSIPMKELEKLAELVDLRPGKTAYYQAVFRASQLDPNLPSDHTNSHVATKLELVTEKCPPVPLHPVL